MLLPRQNMFDLCWHSTHNERTRLSVLHDRTYKTCLPVAYTIRVQSEYSRSTVRLTVGVQSDYVETETLVDLVR